MCKYRSLKKIHVIYDNNPPKENNVFVDTCIADEIEFLNYRGVKTLGCCCGHSERKPNCLIHESSVEICKYLGYQVNEYSSEHTKYGVLEIILKTDTDDTCLKK